MPPRFPGELATELGFSVMHGTFGCDGGGGKRGQGGTAGAIEEAPAMLKNNLYMAVQKVKHIGFSEEELYQIMMSIR